MGYNSVADIMGPSSLV